MIRYMNLRIFVDTFGHFHCRCNFTPGDLETPGIRTKVRTIRFVHDCQHVFRDRILNSKERVIQFGDLMTPKCRKGGTEVDIGGSDTSPPDTLVSSLTVTQE